MSPSVALKQLFSSLRLGLQLNLERTFGLDRLASTLPGFPSTEVIDKCCYQAFP